MGAHAFHGRSAASCLLQLNALLLFTVSSALLQSYWVSAESQVKQIVVISRHGSRGFLTKNHVTFVEDGDSRLTVRGMDQMYHAGQYVQQRYNESVSGLLTGKYNSTEVFVRSSDYARTLNSALSFLLGLYPPMNQTQRTTSGITYSAPYNFQQVPIHTVAIENDQLLRGWLNCTSFIADIKQFYSSSTFKKKESETADFLKKLEQVTGMQNIKLNNFYNVYDFIHLNLVYGNTNLNLTNAEWQKVQYLAGWIESHKYGRAMIGSKGGGILANEIASNFQKTKAGKRKAKMLFYSAHYPTIVSLFSALGMDQDITLNTIPFYASLVIIELLKDVQGQYSVRFAFRNGLGNDTVKDPLEYHKIPGCDDLLCPLEKFSNLVRSLRVRDQKTWCDACDNTDLPVCKLGKPYTRTIAMTAVGGFFTGVFVTIILTVLLVAAWHMCLKKRCMPGGSHHRPVRGLPDMEVHGGGVM